MPGFHFCEPHTQGSSNDQDDDPFSRIFPDNLRVEQRQNCVDCDCQSQGRFVKRQDKTDPKDGARNRAAEVGGKIQYILAGKFFSDHQPGNDHSQDGCKGGCQGAQESGIQDRFDTTRDGHGPMF